MSKEDAEVAALPAYEGSNEERNQEKVAEGGAALGVDRVQEYGYVTRG